MKHILPKLPFDSSALEPFMSRETLEIHYGKHHKTYVDKLNELILGTQYENLSLDKLLREVPEGAIFNNASQAWNHNFFWQSLSPQKQEPTEEVLNAIKKSFGSLDQFKNQFSEAAGGLFGSGWAWLVKDNVNGFLNIEVTSNAKRPILFESNLVLNCDVWEHAYYIDYRNERPKYLKAFWEIINWEFVQKNYSDHSENVFKAAPTPVPNSTGYPKS